MIYIGIDPGQAGAVAMIRRNAYKRLPVVIAPTPTIKIGGGKKGNKRDYDPQEMYQLLAGLISGEAEIFAVLEKQQAFPGQGVVSTGGIMRCFGLWEMALVGLGLPYEVVRPKAWRKVMLAGFPKAGTPKQRKAQSILRAHQLFPAVNLRRTERCPTDSDGYADALLMAEYGRRIREGE